MARTSKKTIKIVDEKVEVSNTNQIEMEKKKKKLLNRIKTVRGHLQGVEKMIEDGKPCDEVLIQVAAIKSSVHRIGAIILNEHAIDCMINPSASEEENREKLEKMIKTLINFSN